MNIPSPPSTPRMRTVSVPRPPGSPATPTYNASPLSGTTPASPGRRASLTPASPPPPTQKTRARDLLRKHYGLGVGPPPVQGPGKSQDPMNLDSTAFDAKSYYEQLITTASLPGLLKRENELLNEIRHLDSERQSLVYNHHHELIAASDTIAAMKTRAESLDADLDLLRVAFSEISRLASEVGVEQTPDP
ncbi:Vps51/Vps67-domain-containing protein [Mycena amicta]|nr:Vps51/Vps67-domain-containing protein [Mycena amicta]